ncbi:MAG: basic amino acid ABC transporter substrate-binding protein, partial [Lachnospiraceae bacterium]|nr:basic amino acid ABC transporter substrate-binding protein [Lachnospiraceae bacterium]
MKRKIALFLTVVMAALSLAGCGGKSDEQAGEDKVYKIA